MQRFRWFHKQLKVAFTPEGVQIRWSGHRLVRLPLASNPQQVLAGLISQGPAWAALEELWEEGLVREEGENRWLLSHRVFEALGKDDEAIFDALGLPPPSAGAPLRCFSRGNVTEPEFRIEVELEHPRFGVLREGEPRRFGSVFLLETTAAASLTAAQRRLFDEAAASPAETLEERMLYLARVRKAALDAQAKLDPYLFNEDYTFADEVGLDLREEAAEEVVLIPCVNGGDEFLEGDGAALLQDPDRRVHSRVTAGGGRRRLVLGEEARGALRQLPPGGRVLGADVARLLTNPEQIVPEGFDLSLFSERVKGLRTRVYNSRPYLHVQRSTGGWFDGVPGVAVEDWSPGDSEDAGAGEENPPDLSPETYRELAQRARETGEEYQPYEGGWIRIDPDQEEGFSQVLEGLPSAGEGTFRIPAGSVLEIYENLELLEFVDSRSLEQLEAGTIPDDVPPVVPPSTFRGALYPHQLEGYRWLARLGDRRLGGLLADDMGLGKTVQVITHMLRIKAEGETGPHLLVVPKTLLENWEREIQRFSGGALTVVRHHRTGQSFSTKMYAGLDLVLTTYGTLRRDQARLATIDWNLVVCDEAQYVKNPTAQRTSALKALKSKHRAALTGTPVENGLIEFWCIMDFVQPGLLGSWKEFRKQYERPIVEGEEIERDRHVKDLLGKIRGHYLRRMKTEILKDLPPKHPPEYRTAGFSDVQSKLYREIARQGKAGGKGAALAAIQKLLFLCAHPGTVVPSLLASGETAESQCPKLEETLRLVDEIKTAGEKVILFSDFKAVQRILQEALRRRFGIWPDIINGELTGNRQAVIDIFSEKPGFNALVLGHQVAGVGLNITAANHVIHYTRPWNPAKENQATDRAHRIGQTRPVHVYYPIVEDERFVTVEKRLDDVIAAKAGLARDVLRPSAELKVREDELLSCLDAVT